MDPDLYPELYPELACAFAAENARKTHCLRGHEFTPQNTYVWRGGRSCRACRPIREGRTA